VNGLFGRDRIPTTSNRTYAVRANLERTIDITRYEVHEPRGGAIVVGTEFGGRRPVLARLVYVDDDLAGRADLVVVRAWHGADRVLTGGESTGGEVERPFVVVEQELISLVSVAGII
jgi:hypothetical protein